MTLPLILSATALAAASGLPGLLGRSGRANGQGIAAAMMAAAAALGLAGATAGLFAHTTATLPLTLPLTGHAAGLAVDALSAFFLFPVFAMGALGSIYGLGYWRQDEHSDNGGKLRLFWGLLVAGMAVVVLARNAVVFLLGWEAMALSAFFLICTEDHVGEVRRAGWIYLVATHLGTLCLFAMFALMRSSTGSFDLSTVLAQPAGMGRMTAIFVLALIGFGLKAGIMPLHFWLPAAHANAPSHVSAMLSGVMIKMGIYGLVRIMSLLPESPVAWGAIVLALGAVSGVLGVVFAIGQHDLKRLLAYHSVENIGIIVMGLGLAMLGRALGRIDWIVLGLAGALLHVWNHGLFKSLLFLSAGSVVHATHTREIDRLGGLAKAMPWTASMFLVGAVAICGLPPLNGFVSEFLIYVGLFGTLGSDGGPAWVGAAMAAPVLAMIGALAVACFVKAYGAVFLGSAREAGIQAHEAPASMIAPMAMIAGGCVLFGLAPFALAPVLDRAIAPWTAHPPGTSMPLAVLAPLGWVGLLALALWGAVAAGSVLLLRQLRSRRVTRQCTWDCGYAEPTPRMQYTSSSFAQMLVGLFGWALRPRVHRPDVSGLFPSATRFESHVDDVVLDGQILPLARRVQRWLAALGGMRQGLTQHYVFYILATVILLLLWTMPLHNLIARFFSR